MQMRRIKRISRTGNYQVLRNVRGGCLVDGEQSGFDEGREQGQGGEQAAGGRGVGAGGLRGTVGGCVLSG